jgi:hypothetical protein
LHPRPDLRLPEILLRPLLGFLLLHPHALLPPLPLHAFEDIGFLILLRSLLLRRLLRGLRAARLRRRFPLALRMSGEVALTLLQDFLLLQFPPLLDLDLHALEEAELLLLLLLLLDFFLFKLLELLALGLPAPEEAALLILLSLVLLLLLFVLFMLGFLLYFMSLQLRLLLLGLARFHALLALRAAADEVVRPLLQDFLLLQLFAQLPLGLHALEDVELLLLRDFLLMAPLLKPVELLALGLHALEQVELLALLFLQIFLFMLLGGVLLLLPLLAGETRPGLRLGLPVGLHALKKAESLFLLPLLFLLFMLGGMLLLRPLLAGEMRLHLRPVLIFMGDILLALLQDLLLLLLLVLLALRLRAPEKAGSLFLLPLLFLLSVLGVVLLLQPLLAGETRLHLRFGLLLPLVLRALEKIFPLILLSGVLAVAFELLSLGKVAPFAEKFFLAVPRSEIAIFLLLALFKILLGLLVALGEVFPALAETAGFFLALGIGFTPAAGKFMTGLYAAEFGGGPVDGAARADGSRAVAFTGGGFAFFAGAAKALALRRGIQAALSAHWRTIGFASAAETLALRRSIHAALSARWSILGAAVISR